LSNEVKGSAVKVVGVPFQVRCGECYWYSTGEVLEA
jgi:hypothetical protein